MERKTRGRMIRLALAALLTVTALAVPGTSEAAICITYDVGCYHSCGISCNFMNPCETNCANANCCLEWL